MPGPNVQRRAVRRPRAIRSAPQGVNVPLALLTAHVDHERRRKGLKFRRPSADGQRSQMSSAPLGHSDVDVLQLTRGYLKYFRPH
jgi:hypothetical protein